MVFIKNEGVIEGEIVIIGEYIVEIFGVLIGIDWMCDYF